MTDQEIIKEVFDEAVREIIALQQTKGIKASGRSAEKLQSLQAQNVFQIIDQLGYFESQEFGKPPSITNEEDLYKWLALKKYGLDWKTDKQRRNIARAIAFKHKKSGSYLYRNKIQTGVITEVINDDLVKKIITRITERNTTEVLTDVTRIFK